MRIVYLGNFLQPHCTEVHLAREMEGLGHEVLRVQEQQRPHRAVLAHLSDACDRHFADLFMWTRTWGLPSSAKSLWRGLERRGVATMSYHLDLYYGLNRAHGLSDDPFWRTQYVFTPDGNEDAAKAFADLGINHFHLPPAVVSDECYRGANLPERYPVDVAFVGTGQPPYHREWPWRGELLRALRGRRFQFGHYGLGGLPTIRNADLNDLYATVPVIVGDSLALHPADREMYTSDRIFETLGRGGLLLYPRLRAITDLGFVPMEHYVPYEQGSQQSLLDAVDLARSNPQVMDRIRHNGYQFVKYNHTYRHRLQYALAVVEAGR
jgi:hypothetical protein